MEFVLLSGLKGFSATASVRTITDAVSQLQQQSLNQGKDKMTLEEINHEIKMARKPMNK